MVGLFKCFIASLMALGLMAHRTICGKCLSSELILQIGCCNIEDTHTQMPYVGRVCTQTDESHTHTHTLWLITFVYFMHSCFMFTHTHRLKICFRHPVQSQATEGSFRLHANCYIAQMREFGSFQVIYSNRDGMDACSPT